MHFQLSPPPLSFASVLLCLTLAHCVSLCPPQFYCVTLSTSVLLIFLCLTLFSLFHFLSAHVSHSVTLSHFVHHFLTLPYAALLNAPLLYCLTLPHVIWRGLVLSLCPPVSHSASWYLTLFNALSLCAPMLDCHSPQCYFNQHLVLCLSTCFSLCPSLSHTVHLHFTVSLSLLLAHMVLSVHVCHWSPSAP